MKTARRSRGKRMAKKSQDVFEEPVAAAARAAPKEDPGKPGTIVTWHGPAGSKRRWHGVEFTAGTGVNIAQLPAETQEAMLKNIDAGEGPLSYQHVVEQQ